MVLTLGLGAGLLVVMLAAVSFYYQLWRWARMCQHARITCAYKGKVKIDAPLVEWLMWCNQLKGDQASNGRVVLAAGGVQIAVLRPSRHSYGPLAAIRRMRRRRLVTPREGTWSATDQTRKQNG